MPAKTRVFRFDAGESGPSARSPASLGAWIRDVPHALARGWRCVAVADARHLLCWGTDNGVFMYDYLMGSWLDPFVLGPLDDAQHAEEEAIKDICCTQDFILVDFGGGYHVLAFSGLGFWQERWGEEIIDTEKVIPVEDVGEQYKNLFLVPAPNGIPGVDLISVHPSEVRRTYRLPPAQTDTPNYHLEWFDFNRELVIASFSSQESTSQWVWDLETGQLKNQVNLSVPYRRGEWGRPFLDERYLHFWSTLIELPSFRSVHTFGVRRSLLDPLDIVGIASDKVVTAEVDSSEDEIFGIYLLPGFQKVQEIKIEGYRWIPELHSHRYFLLAKIQGVQDFILVKLEDFIKMD